MKPITLRVSFRGADAKRRRARNPVFIDRDYWIPGSKGRLRPSEFIIGPADGRTRWRTMRPRGLRPACSPRNERRAYDSNFKVTELDERFYETDHIHWCHSGAPERSGGEPGIQYSRSVVTGFRALKGVHARLRGLCGHSAFGRCPRPGTTAAHMIRTSRSLNQSLGNANSVGVPGGKPRRSIEKSQIKHLACPTCRNGTTAR
jgi:hypothetical protein